MASETQSKVDEAMHGDEAPDAEEDEQERIRKRKEKAVREREEKVSAERSRVGAEIGRSRLALNKDEGEREFRCATWPCHPPLICTCLIALIMFPVSRIGPC
jgi:heat shock protein beta